MYTSASEVVREALRLMDGQNRLRAAGLEQLRDDVREGLVSGGVPVLERGKGEARGPCTPCAPCAQGNPAGTPWHPLSRRPLAALGIVDICDHIADDDMAAADRRVDELDTAFSRIATQSRMGRARPELAPDRHAR